MQTTELAFRFNPMYKYLYMHELDDKGGGCDQGVNIHLGGDEGVNTCCDDRW